MNTHVGNAWLTIVRAVVRLTSASFPGKGPLTEGSMLTPHGNGVVLPMGEAVSEKQVGPTEAADMYGIFMVWGELAKRRRLHGAFIGCPRWIATVQVGLAMVFLFLAGSWTQAGPTDPTISYQGRLLDGGNAAAGSYDFQFLLMDAATGGQALGQTISATLTVRQGVFTTPLAFPAELFTGAARWVEVRVRPTPASGSVEGSYAVLERQQVQFAPYALRAVSAGTVTSVPEQSLPASVLLKNANGRLDSALLGVDIARTTDVTALTTVLQQAQTQLSALQSRITALEQSNLALAQSLQAAAAPVRSGWMVASADAADAGLLSAGFTRAFSTQPPPWVTTATDAAPTARQDASGVWTGSELLVWGGRGIGQLPVANGSGYRPDTDSWREISPWDAPEARSGHTAVWTGSEMIIWGGFGRAYLATGGRFARGTFSWQPTAIQSAPVARQGHGAAWTGKGMVIFGGRNLTGMLNDGGFYEPALDRWTALPVSGAPSARSGATVVWTGSGVLVWGGETGAGGDATGSLLRFDASGMPKDWVALPLLGGFLTRSEHVSAWDGQRLMVWGGRGPSRQLLGDGAVLDLAAGTWTSIGSTGAPTARYRASGVWTGDELVVAGGVDASGAISGGHAWKRTSGVWRSLPTPVPSVSRSGSVACWTGSDLLLFGGQGGSLGTFLANGQRIAVVAPWHFYRRDPQ